jgi:segregation and condensation protein B
MLNPLLKKQILAILFAARDPVELGQLAEVFDDISIDELSQAAAELLTEFNSLQEAVELRKVAGGYRLTTRPEHHDVIRRYLRTKPSARLSQAALETLSVIAYKQPITLPEIMEIRGIKGTSTIKTLLEKKLIEIRGRKKVVGRPILYGTTQEFLVKFGLNDLTELPSLEEFEELYGADDSEVAVEQAQGGLFSKLEAADQADPAPSARR